MNKFEKWTTRTSENPISKPIDEITLWKNVVNHFVYFSTMNDFQLFWCLKSWNYITYYILSCFCHNAKYEFLKRKRKWIENHEFIKVCKILCGWNSIVWMFFFLFHQNFGTKHIFVKFCSRFASSKARMYQQDTHYPLPIRGSGLSNAPPFSLFDWAVSIKTHITNYRGSFIVFSFCF